RNLKVPLKEAARLLSGAGSLIGGEADGCLVPSEGMGDDACKHALDLVIGDDELGQVGCEGGVEAS
ncbi:hypothetical protein PJP10_32110, partial [Mycobacterium kansasii]